MKNKIKYFIFSFIFVLFLSGGVIYGFYFVSNTMKLHNLSTNITTDPIIEVSSFDDLLTNGTSDTYNDYNKVSESTNRKILKLLDDITLTNNIILNKDIHLDLNGNKLFLNNYELAFKHGYYGSFSIYNGTVVSGDSGKITIDLPNATFIDYNIHYYKSCTESGNESISKENIITSVNVNPKYTAYSALYRVFDSISSEIATRPAYKTFTEVSEIATFESNMFINSYNCSFNNNESESCAIIYKDLDLMFSYLSSDIVISYSSSDTSILDNYGYIKGYGDVELEITISNKKLKSSYSVTVKLHVIDIEDSTSLQQAGLKLIKDYLSPYYHNGDLVIKDSTILKDYYYKFEHAIDLPYQILGNNITFSYKTTDLSGNISYTSDFIKNKNENVYLFSPSLNDYHLVISINNTETSLNMYSTYVGLEETVAYYISNYLYGGSIIYDKASTGKNLVAYSDEVLSNVPEGSDYSDLKKYLVKYGVTSISYILKNDSSVKNHYDLTNNNLVVKSSSIPADKEGFVTMQVYFGEKQYDIDLYVEYLDSNGTTLSSYLTYYSIYNSLVPSELETSFDLPFCTNGVAPYTCYDVATYTTKKVPIDSQTFNVVTPTYTKPVNLKVELWYDGASKYTFEEYSSKNVSFTTQLDNYLKANNLKLSDLASKNAFYRFSVDAQNSLDYNTKLVLIYNYKFESSAIEWSRYQNNQDSISLTDNNTTFFTLLGGLFYNTTVTANNAVKDSNFFIWIYNRFKPSSYDAIVSATSDRIIPINWLGQSAIITKVDTGLNSVTDYSGISYLTGITEADLSGSRITINILTGIAKLKFINKLTLRNCSIYDISALSKLSESGTLRILDISNNNISYFETITSITSLEKVYLYGNNIDNKYIGSKGICNFQSYADLMRNGCAVYNDISNDVPVLYAESNNLDDYRRLKEIAYQEKLKEGSSIEQLYSVFIALGNTITDVSGDYRPGSNPFGLQTAGTLDWGYEGDSNDGAKYQEATVTADAAITDTYYEYSNGAYTITTDTKFKANKTYYIKIDNTNATYFYVTLKYSNSSGGYILKVKYYIERY